MATIHRARQALEHPLAKKTAHRYRRHIREMWKSRGGGFYGFVAVLTLVYLEAVDLAGDIAGGIALSLGWVISFFVSNVVGLALNLLWSALWPLTWISRFGIDLQSAALLAGAYVGYRAIRPAVVRLLEEPEDAAPSPAPQTDGPTRV